MIAQVRALSVLIFVSAYNSAQTVLVLFPVTAALHKLPPAAFQEGNLFGGAKLPRCNRLVARPRAQEIVVLS